MDTGIAKMIGLPGMARSVVLTFSHGWKPGEYKQVTATDVATAVEQLGQGWCWPPDESSPLALEAHKDILVDALRSGDAAFLMRPLTADLVHLQPDTE